MTLTDIKNKIIEQLNIFTIDDFYFDPEVNFAKEIFYELTKNKSKEQIEKYLIDKFPETIVEGKTFPIKLSINQLNDQITKADSVIKDLEKTFIKLDKQTENNKSQLSEIPQKKSQSQSALKEIEMEIEQIKPLSNKAPYTKRMNELEKEKNKINLEINTFEKKTEELKREISELQNKTNEVNKNIKEKVKEIKNIESKRNNAQKELQQQNKNEFYDSEYSSLEFLFKILIKKSINKIELEEKRKTGKKIELPYNRYAFGNNIIDEIVSEKTGEIKLEIDDFNEENCKELILPFAKKVNIVPSDWRKIIYQILASPLPNLAGTIYNNDYYNNYNVNREILELTNEDISALLATKIAIKEKNSIITADNKIVLEISGGISATITFREKGKQIEKFQKEKIEIYSNCLLTSRFVGQTLYKQNGYTVSYIEINTPGAYYILNDKFVIEIYFNPAPILLDNNNEIKFSTNTSDKYKLEDEEEEEQRRKKELEDLCDDDF